jgi:hypothetical protein
VNTSLDGPRYNGQPDIGVSSSLPPLTDAPELVCGPGSRLAARAWPNPFRGDTLIEYALPAASEVTVKLYDLGGRVARTLVDHAQQAAGNYRLPLRGRALSPGVYLYEIVAGDQRVHGKLVLLR